MVAQGRSSGRQHLRDRPSPARAAALTHPLPPSTARRGRCGSRAPRFSPSPVAREPSTREAPRRGSGAATLSGSERVGCRPAVRALDRAARRRDPRGRIVSRRPMCRTSAPTPTRPAMGWCLPGPRRADSGGPRRRTQRSYTETGDARPPRVGGGGEVDAPSVGSIAAAAACALPRPSMGRTAMHGHYLADHHGRGVNPGAPRHDRSWERSVDRWHRRPRDPLTILPRPHCRARGAPPLLTAPLAAPTRPRRPRRIHLQPAT